jgi:hypothetical protein
MTMMNTSLCPKTLEGKTAMKPGVELLEEVPGLGALLVRKLYYDFRLRMWLSRGDPIRWTQHWGPLDPARIEDEGATLYTSLRVDRGSMFAGLLTESKGCASEAPVGSALPRI